MSPIGTTLFYLVTSVLQGETSQVPTKLKEKFVPTLIASYTLWPAAHAINFKFVPSQQRILYTNIVSVSTALFPEWFTFSLLDWQLCHHAHRIAEHSALCLSCTCMLGLSLRLSHHGTVPTCIVQHHSQPISVQNPVCVLGLQILWTYILSQAAAATVSAQQPVIRGEEPEPLTIPQQVAVFLTEEEQVAAMQLVVEELASNPPPEDTPAEPASAT